MNSRKFNSLLVLKFAKLSLARPPPVEIIKKLMFRCTRIISIQKLMKQWLVDSLYSGDPTHSCHWAISPTKNIKRRYKITLLPSKKCWKRKSCYAPYSVNSTKQQEVRKMIVILHSQNQKASLGSGILTRVTNKKESVAVRVMLFLNWRNDSSSFGCKSSLRCTTRLSYLTRLSPRAHKTTLKRFVC